LEFEEEVKICARDWRRLARAELDAALDVPAERSEAG